MSRFLVTGAAGFIGAQVVRRALAAGHDVAAVLRPGHAAPRLDGAEQVGAGTLVRWSHDLADRVSIDALGEAARAWAPDALIHLAWYVTPGKYLQARENIDCVGQSLALLERMLDAGCRGVVMTGTCAEYNTDREVTGCFSEDAPTRPATLYAASKLALCTVARQLATDRKIPLAWARLFYLYGPWEEPSRLVPAVIRALLADRPFPATAGEQVRDYLHVEDVADALVTLAAAKADGVYNVASGEPSEVRQLLSLVGELAGRPDLLQLGALPYRAWEPPRICGDVSRLRDLGWSPRHSLRSGLAETIDWWRSRDAAILHASPTSLSPA